MAAQGFKKSKYTSKPVGACYLKGNKFSIGSNSIKTAPIGKELDSRYHRTHAEMNAINNTRRMDISVEGGTIFVYRELKDGSFANSRPCKSCQSLLRKRNITRACYTISNGYAWEDFS